MTTSRFTLPSNAREHKKRSQINLSSPQWQLVSNIPLFLKNKMQWNKPTSTDFRTSSVFGDLTGQKCMWTIGKKSEKYISCRLFTKYMANFQNPVNILIAMGNSTNLGRKNSWVKI